MTTLGLLAIFRNEAHILEEFIEHYKWQGVDKFYLINNASSDEFLGIVQKYGDLIELHEETFVSSCDILEAGGKQIDAYNRVLGNVTTTWLYVCDLDEFAYGQHGYNLKTFIQDASKDVKYTQYLIPLKTFNSSGNIAQPASVVQGFTKRRSGEQYALYKPIAKTDCIKKIKVNYCHMLHGLTTNTSKELVSDNFVLDKIEQTELVRMRQLTPETFTLAQVVSNHYTTQSREWFFNVKATRGTATWHGGPKMPAIDWFTHMWNRAENFMVEEDTTLIELYANYKRTI